MEEATRLRQTTCPWQAMRDPFVIAVLDAHRWWKERQLEAMYAGQIPESIRRGVNVYESAMNAVLAHDREIDRKRRDAEAAERASVPGVASFARPSLMRRRR